MQTIHAYHITETFHLKITSNTLRLRNLVQWAIKKFDGHRHLITTSKIEILEFDKYGKRVNWFDLEIQIPIPKYSIEKSPHAFSTGNHGFGIVNVLKKPRLEYSKMTVKETPLPPSRYTPLPEPTASNIIELFE